MVNYVEEKLWSVVSTETEFEMVVEGYDTMEEVEVVVDKAIEDFMYVHAKVYGKDVKKGARLNLDSLSCCADTFNEVQSVVGRLLSVNMTFLNAIGELAQDLKDDALEDVEGIKTMFGEDFECTVSYKGDVDESEVGKWLWAFVNTDDEYENFQKAYGHNFEVIDDILSEAVDNLVELHSFVYDKELDIVDEVHRDAITDCMLKFVAYQSEINDDFINSLDFIGMISVLEYSKDNPMSDDDNIKDNVLSIFGKRFADVVTYK